jgi:TonB family protein
MMGSHTDILDRPERLWASFWGSVALHLSVAAAVLATVWYQTHHPRENWGDINGGGLGSVAVNVVPRIPLPTESGPVNPVANDTESRAPEPPAKVKPQAKVRAPDPDAIRIPSRNARKKPAPAASAPNKFRAQQQDLPNQVYSQSGQRMVSPMVGLTGGGGVSIGNNSTFGAQFGAYSDMVKNKVARNWRTTDIDPRIRVANPVVVTFTINRDGSVPSQSVKIGQTSGIPTLDLSAQRAILDASPFMPLPPQFPRNSADIEFHFELRR